MEYTKINGLNRPLVLNAKLVLSLNIDDSVASKQVYLVTKLVSV